MNYQSDDPQIAISALPGLTARVIRISAPTGESEDTLQRMFSTEHTPALSSSLPSNIAVHFHAGAF
ncbi:hypothetical protein AOQ72_10705 [Bradyrhizobium yuanmingense]|uniref:Uncharacterized protein n=1 Tax=Bradyrhizobium yuanmingense TaxID=108015 RepID=A0A0R3CS70_9BRAD|nr:hypothetical protein AOQ72_10705 [Bradyrhizobium yuanmingense]